MNLENELKFILAMDALKSVERRNYNLDESRRENTAEHSWQIVVLAQILYPYAKNKESISLLRVLRMLSIHDIVEIKAGDTFLFDGEAMIGKYERELEAAKSLFGMLDNSIGEEFLELWMEFEAEDTPDAIFACAVDRIMPFLLNCATSAKSWKEAGIKASQVESMVGEAVRRASAEMGELFYTLFEESIKNGKLLS